MTKSKRGQKRPVQGDLFASPPQPVPPGFAESKEGKFLADKEKGEWRKKALEWARGRGPHGYTMTEFLNAFDLWGVPGEHGIVDLAFADLVTDTGRTREYRGGHETVWVACATQWWQPEDSQSEPNIDAKTQESDHAPLEEGPPGQVQQPENHGG